MRVMRAKRGAPLSWISILGIVCIALVLFTGSRKRMGEFVNGPWLNRLAWFTAALIAGLNGWLLVETFMGK